MHEMEEHQILSRYMTEPIHSSISLEYPESDLIGQRIHVDTPILELEHLSTLSFCPRLEGFGENTIPTYVLRGSGCEAPETEHVESYLIQM
jgi:hypothetical protein